MQTKAVVTGALPLTFSESAMKVLPKVLGLVESPTEAAASILGLSNPFSEPALAAVPLLQSECMLVIAWRPVQEARPAVDALPGLVPRSLLHSLAMDQ